MTERIDTPRRDGPPRPTDRVAPVVAREAGAAPDPRKPRWSIDRIEDTVKIGILLAIAVAGLAASFSHMHDWTMRHMPDGTPGWFGWANACISELLPIATFLTIRRRLARQQPYGYPGVLLLGGAALSLGAQLAAVGSQASLSAKFLSMLPALAFMALSKMILGDIDAARKIAAAAAAGQAEAEAAAARKAEVLRRLRAEAEAARQAQAEAEARAEAEAAARAEAEAEAARQAEALRRLEAETEAAAARYAAASGQSESARQSELARSAEALRVARVQAAEQADAARRAVQELAESQRALTRVTSEVDQFRARLSEAEARAEAEAAARAEAEAEAARQAETLRRLEAEAETSGRRPLARKLAAVPVTRLPVALPADGSVPVIEGVRPETVAAVLAARTERPEATQGQLAEMTGISDRTIRKVLSGLPTTNGHQVLAGNAG